MQTNQIQSLRQTHRSVSTLMPLVTAALTITGVVLANIERNAQRNPQGQAEDLTPRQPQVSQPQKFAYPYALAPQVTRMVPVVTPVTNPIATRQVAYRPRRLTIFGFLGALLWRVLMVLIGMVAVAAIVGLYFAADPTWRAIELTTLILLILYLTERVARARRS
jgi:hypothetical protein